MSEFCQRCATVDAENARLRAIVDGLHRGMGLIMESAEAKGYVYELRGGCGERPTCTLWVLDQLDAVSCGCADTLPLAVAKAILAACEEAEP